MTRDLTIKTHVGWAGWEEHRHFGLRVFAELAGTESYAGLLALAVTGRRFTPDEAAVLDDLAACMSITEPRIWPMKVSRLVSSYGRVVPGYLAGAMCFESELIGPWTTGATAECLLELERRVGGDADDDEAVARHTGDLLEARGKLIGFGVPFRPKDERVMALTTCIERRGRDELPYWRLATRMWSALRTLRGLEPNISSALVAACLDLGLTSEEIPPLTVALTHNIFLANAVEAAKLQSEPLLALPIDRIDYVGTAPRRSPRAAS